MQDAPYRLIPLHDRAGLIVGHTKVSAEDFDALAIYPWHINGKNGYAIRSDAQQRTVLMSRQILGLQRGDKREADHINRDRLDNRRENLRAVTKAENAVNRGSNPNSTSRFRGVCWHRAANAWQAQARHRCVKYYLGVFVLEEDAARAINDFWTERGYPAPNDV